MRTQLARYIVIVLLFGLSTLIHQANGFGFNFTPAAPPAIPLSVAANAPFPFPFPGPACGAAPFCPPPTIVVAPPFGAPPPYFPPPFPPAYPAPYPYPYPPPPSPFPYPPPDLKQSLFSSILDAILSRKGNTMNMSPPRPPPSMMQHSPQQSRIQVHLIRDSGHDQKRQNHHHQNHWRDERTKWN